MKRSSSLVAVTVSILTSSIFLAGCGAQETSPLEPPPEPSTAVVSPEPSTPVPRSEPSTPAVNHESPTAVASAPPDAPAPVVAIEAAMLLPAQDMPPWNGRITWQLAPPDALVADAPACTLPAPDSLGAVQFLTATYRGGYAMGGSNTIMLFPDEPAAQAALQVYESVMPGCLNQEPQRGLITDDPSASSWTGARDCSFTGNPACGGNEALFEFVGVGAQANTATLVSFNLIGQDANWCMPPTCKDGRDPVLPEVYASLERMNAK